MGFPAARLQSLRSYQHNIFFSNSAIALLFIESHRSSTDHIETSNEQVLRKQHDKTERVKLQCCKSLTYSALSRVQA